MADICSEEESRKEDNRDMKRQRKKIVSTILLVLLILGMLGGCQKQAAPEEAASKQQDVDAWMETEDEEYFDVEDAKDAEKDYSKYEGTSSKKSNTSMGDTDGAEVSGNGENASRQDQYHTDPIPEGQQKPVEPEDVTIDEEAIYTCYLTVACDTILDNLGDLKEGKEAVVPANGIIYYRSEVAFYKGESVYDVLYRAMRESGIHMDAAFTPMYNSYYVRGINNLYERDCGDPSGWMYCVNGWYPNYGCSRYAVQDGDEIEWNYTCDGGGDLGQNWMD